MTECKSGCGSEAVTRGYCKAHYCKARRNGLLKKIERPTMCEMADCSSDRYCMDLCKAHYAQLKRTGSPIRAKLCKSDGCTRDAHAKGLCNKCYYRVFVAKKKAVPIPPLVAASVQRAAIKETRRKRLAKRGIVQCAF